MTSKRQQWRIPLKNPLIQVTLSLLFPLMLVRFAWGLKQIPWKKDNNMPIACDFRTKVWLKNYLRVARQHFFLIRSLKVIKRANVMNQYNQVPHLVQDESR